MPITEEKEQIVRIKYGNVVIEKRETPGECAYTLRQPNRPPFILDQDGWLNLQACIYDVLMTEKKTKK